MHQYELSTELGDFVFVDKGSVFGKHKDYSIIKKDDLYNVISAADGILFEEWFSEIIKIRGLFQVKRVANQSDKEEEKNDSKENLVLEYNLALPDGTFALEEWSRNMIITPFQNAFLVNLKPLVQKSPNGKINDNNITYFSSGYGHNCYEPIQKIQGSCNIITDRLLFNTWFDSITFLKSKVFSDDGFVKVFKDGKCNLINEKGDYVSLEWFDDIIAANNYRIFSDDGYVKVLKDGKCNLINEKGDYYSSEWFDDVLIGSEINSIIPRAIHVKKEGKENYLLGGELVFSQWFASISPLRGDYYSPNEAYEVSDGKSKGIYFLGKGLFCGRLYDGIRRISEDLFLCHYEKTGHIVSLDGELILTASIEKVGRFCNGIAVVTKDNSRLFNFINQKGIIVSPVWFDAIHSESGSHGYFKEDISSERFIVYNKKRGWNLIDNKGNILCQEWYDKIYSLPQFDKGVLVVESERGRNILGKDNKLTLPNWTDGEICTDFMNPYNAIIMQLISKD